MTHNDPAWVRVGCFPSSSCSQHNIYVIFFQISSQERQRLLQAAFSGTVKEKSTELPAFPTQPSSSTKPVSKFKSQAASRNTERTVTQTHAESAKEMDSTGSERPVSKFRAERLKKS